MSKDTNNSAVNHNETKMQLHPCRVYKAVGFDDDDLERYTIGIANAFSDIVPGHFHLRQVAEFVKKVSILQVQMLLSLVL